MSTLLNEKIEQVIKNRQEKLPLIEKRIEQWNGVVLELRHLEEAVDNLIKYKELSGDFKTVLQQHDIRGLQEIAKDTIDKFEKVLKRVKRPTVNIGVSGQARVGKSTLLQTIAGLTDDHIPTGKGDPVTAVRSRIFHSPNRRAIIKFHSYSSFRENILVPYHTELGFDSPPRTLDEYQNHSYSVSDQKLNEWESRIQSLYKRLRDMHDAFPSYREDLHGQEVIKDLSELREFVAYPTGEKEKEKDCPRRYLAVQDAKIECKFPKFDVKNVGLIDLPGMGEIDVEAQTRHVQGLQDDVDLMLLIKRPIEGMAYWRDEDARTVGYLDQARGVDKKDYVIIVSNEGGCDEELIGKMLDSIHRNANLNVKEQFFEILKTDAKNEESVSANVMNPILEHLAQRLPEMDHNIFRHAIESSKIGNKNIRSGVDNLSRDIRDNISYASDDERLDKLIEKLHDDMAEGLKTIVDDYFKQANSDKEYMEFIRSVHKIEDDILLWIDGGLGREGEQEWKKNAVRKMVKRDGSAGFAENEFNRIRVHISYQFSEIDDYFRREVEKLLKRIENVMSKNMGSLLTDIDSDVLPCLKKLFDEASEPCDTLSDVLTDLLGLEIKYRTYLYPRIRKSLDEIKCQAVTVSLDDNGAEKLYNILCEKAKFAVGEYRRAILNESNMVPSILHAACEQFGDAVSRSGDAEQQFKRLGRSYRNEIWPEEFSGMGSENARVSKVGKISGSIKHFLQEMENNADG